MENKEYNVLTLEYQKVFGTKVAIQIVYQDCTILKKGEFFDSELNVISSKRFGFDFDDDTKRLFILGSNEELDFDAIIVTEEDAEIIKDKVRKLNEKYGKLKRWKGSCGDKYYFIQFANDGMEIEGTEELNDSIDLSYWQYGNYFKTEEEAQKVVDKIEEIFKEIRNGVDK